MIIVNFKDYVHGKKALILAKRIEKHLPKAVIAVSAVDIFNIKVNTKLEVYAQHVDLSPEQRSTGFITIGAIKALRISGTLLNHSEHPIGLDEIDLIVANLKKVKLRAIVCAPALKFVKELLKLKNKPYAIAFEDPRLIATERPITMYSRDDLIRFVKILRGKEIVSICGAGISSLEDVIVARELGFNGVLIASAIANAKQPDKLLNDLEGIKF